MQEKKIKKTIPLLIFSLAAITPPQHPIFTSFCPNFAKTGAIHNQSINHASVNLILLISWTPVTDISPARRESKTAPHIPRAKRFEDGSDMLK